jgi:hypothetical protein
MLFESARGGSNNNNIAISELAAEVRKIIMLIIEIDLDQIVLCSSSRRNKHSESSATKVLGAVETDLPKAMNR